MSDFKNTNELNEIIENYFKVKVNPTAKDLAEHLLVCSKIQQQQSAGVWQPAYPVPIDGMYFCRCEEKYSELRFGNYLEVFSGKWCVENDDFNILLYLDESEYPQQKTINELLIELGEKEVMITAFAKVRQLFDNRSWIIEGRGPYVYNDDEYKKEVTYLYEEFDALQKDVFANIKTKTFEYREKIIQQQQNSAGVREGLNRIINLSRVLLGNTKENRKIKAAYAQCAEIIKEYVDNSPSPQTKI